MTVPMIIDKVENYEHRIGVVNKRLAGAFFRTLGDSLYPETISEGTQILDSARINIQADTTLSGNQLRKKERQLRSLERQVKNELQLITSYQKGRNKYQVEIHKKFSIPFACILFVLLGAPLGVMAKRGGFAISPSLSFGFFLLYYILLIGGEEMADRNQVPAWIGMWTPNAVVLIVSLYLILHTVRERAPISLLSFIKNREKSNP